MVFTQGRLTCRSDVSVTCRLLPTRTRKSTGLSVCVGPLKGDRHRHVNSTRRFRVTDSLVTDTLTRDEVVK